MKRAFIGMVLGLGLAGIAGALGTATARIYMSKAVGIVQSVNVTTSRITITGKNQQSVTISYNSQTKFFRQGKPEAVSNIQTGESVSIRFDLATQTAQRIDVFKVAPAPVVPAGIAPSNP